MTERVLIVGTGLIGASIGLGLRQAGFAGEILGWDESPEALRVARDRGAVDEAAEDATQALAMARTADVVVLAGPVFAIRDWMGRLAPVCGPRTLVTDVGSTKLEITEAGRALFGSEGAATFLPGHPMAGKERGGPELAEAELFRGAMWLFTPEGGEEAEGEVARAWRGWVERMGARTMDLEARRHDELCAWVSHLPQMLSTALAALLEERFGDAPEIAAIGGRALRETTRLGASPYSMWRDVAMTNTGPLAEVLLLLEQELGHVRENLRTPELREEFLRANRFRARGM